MFERCTVYAQIALSILPDLSVYFRLVLSFCTCTALTLLAVVTCHQCDLVASNLQFFIFGVVRQFTCPKVVTHPTTNWAQWDQDQCVTSTLNHHSCVPSTIFHPWATVMVARCIHKATVSTIVDTKVVFMKESFRTLLVLGSGLGLALVRVSGKVSIMDG